jgi:hypothetical protein
MYFTRPLLNEGSVTGVTALVDRFALKSVLLKPVAAFSFRDEPDSA